MKKLYFLSVAAFCSSFAGAQITFPDNNLKDRLLFASTADEYHQIAKDLSGNWTSIDTNANGEIETAEAQNISYLDLSGGLHITDMTGIAEFTNLKWLDCSYNDLTTFDATSLTQLEYLNVYHCFLTSLSVQGMSNLTELDCSSNDLLSLATTGLNNLKKLNYQANTITSIDFSPLSNLEVLQCSVNNIVTLPLDGLPNLKEFHCNGNQLLTSLDMSVCPNLELVDCDYNSLTSLNVSGLTNLEILRCDNNELTSLQVSSLTNLKELRCAYNSIATLDLSGLSHLELVICYHNQISDLELTGLTSIADLLCSSNLLTAIDVNNLVTLKTFDCSNNQLTSLTVSSLIDLQSFHCQSNQLTSIDVSTLNNLSYFGIGGNPMTSIDLTNLSSLTHFYAGNSQFQTLNLNNSHHLGLLQCQNSLALTTLYAKNGAYENYQLINFSGCPALTYICADEFELTMYQSLAQYYGYSGCTVNSYCSVNPGGDLYDITGTNHYDANGDGCNASDIYFPNLRFLITNGTISSTIFCDNSGNYTIPVEAGTHTAVASLENPDYFTVSPSGFSVDFPTETSPSVHDLCISQNGSHPDLEVVVLPLINAVPGFDAQYKIIYKNKGTAIESGSVVLDFDDSRLDFITSAPIASSQLPGSISWSFTNLMPFETKEITLTMNINSPTDTPAVNADDILSYGVALTSALTDETPEDNAATLNQVVVNSLDPNDKTCLEGAVISPEAAGKYVHYMIRFENNGTASAQDIVVADVIDPTKFDINSLVPLSGSHAFITRIVNNKVEFVFENINLPFDNASNDGYVAFKIKIKPSLVVGDVFSNNASIYFDYNFPIVTNTATTAIQLLGNPDFEFSDAFTLYPNPARNTLNIQSKSGTEIKSVRIYNVLGQLIQVQTGAVSTIDVSSLQIGQYFIKADSDKGNATSRFIKQ